MVLKRGERSVSGKGETRQIRPLEMFWKREKKMLCAAEENNTQELTDAWMKPGTAHKELLFYPKRLCSKASAKTLLPLPWDPCPG